MRGGLGARASALTIPFCLYHTDHDQNTWVIIVGMLVPIIAAIVASIYIFYRQRKIRIYKLQKAQEEALRLKVQAPPP